MALKGTLKDFGIADILQLIGQQQKTGALHLTNRGDEVTVYFRDGNIVAAVAQSRTKSDLIGTMLVRAGLISEGQLELALETQKRTLQRLGDVLVQQGAITEQRFRDMVALQTSETLYKLFGWKSGNYSFEQRDFEVESFFTPLRAETVLMEGFRRVDEWPVVKKRITSPAMSFERVKELPPAPPTRDAFDAALDNAFDEGAETLGKGEFESVGEPERKCYQLVKPGRTVQSIIDQSCLGEFEASKALCNLVNLDYLKPVAAAGRAEVYGEETRLSRALGVLGRLAVSVLVIGALGFVVARLDLGSLRLGASSASTYTDPAAQRFASTQQMARIRAALEVYRLDRGALPATLTALEEGGLLSADDLRYPWRENYYYRRAESGFVLLPPLR
jgi:hypothetical protein